MSIYTVVTHIANEYAASAQTSSAVTLADYGTPYKVRLLVSATISGGTVDCKITGCATSGGTYADVTGGAITQLTATGIRYVDVVIPNGVNFLKVVLTPGTAAQKASSTLIFDEPHYE